MIGVNICLLVVIKVLEDSRCYIGVKSHYITAGRFCYLLSRVYPTVLFVLFVSLQRNVFSRRDIEFVESSLEETYTYRGIESYHVTIHITVAP